MYCKYCGKQIADDSIFCNYCGASQGLYSLDNRKMKTTLFNKTSIANSIIFISKELAIWVVICVAVCLIAAMVEYFLGAGSDTGAIVVGCIVLLIVGRYIVKLVKWVNRYKSRE